MPFKTVLSALLSAIVGLASVPSSPLKDEERRVIAVTLDGMRWQEVFGGAERSLITNPSGGVADTARVLATFWRASIDERRTALMPFLWGMVARQGQLLGDSSRGSIVRLTNGKRFSYPGYNELLTGTPDPRIDSNDKLPNPNVSVLEWLNALPAFRGKVEAYGSWDVLPYILNTERSRLPVNGDGPPFPAATDSVRIGLNEMAADLPLLWAGSRLDAVTMSAALAALKSRRVQVLYVLLGETDEWAHERRYDRYLDAAHRADQFLARLWETVAALPEYRGRTTLLVSTDHGRGAASDWTDHGRDVPAAERIWLAAIGPSISPLGVRSGLLASQAQFAATLARAVGQDWTKESVTAARPIIELFDR